MSEMRYTHAFTKLLVKRDCLTTAYKAYTVVLKTEEKEFLLGARNIEELKILWNELTDIELNIQRIQTTVVMKYKQEDEFDRNGPDAT